MFQRMRETLDKIEHGETREGKESFRPAAVKLLEFAAAALALAYGLDRGG